MLDLVFGLAGQFWPYIIAAGGAVVAFFLARKGGKDAVEADIAKDAAKRADAGRSAQAKAQKDIAAGKTPEQVVRDNDGAWGQ